MTFIFPSLLCRYHQGNLAQPEVAKLSCWFSFLILPLFFYRGTFWSMLCGLWFTCWWCSSQQWGGDGEVINPSGSSENVGMLFHVSWNSFPVLQMPKFSPENMRDAVHKKRTDNCRLSPCLRGFCNIDDNNIIASIHWGCTLCQTLLSGLHMYLFI